MRVSEQVKIDGEQFGFTPGKSTTDAIFIVRQVQGKFHFRFVADIVMQVDVQKAKTVLRSI